MISAKLNSKNVIFKWIIFVGLLASETCAYSAPKIPGCEFTQAEIQDVDGARRTIERLRHEGCLEKVRQTESCLARAALLSEDVAGFFRTFRGKDAATMTAVSALAQSRSAILDSDLNLWRNVDVIQDLDTWMISIWFV